MPKNKKPRVPNHNHHDGPKNRSAGGGKVGKKQNKKMVSFSKLNTSISKAKRTAKGDYKPAEHQKQQQQQQQHAAIVPFQPRDRILLVGEGDFSFASSLATRHGCKSVLATSYDSEKTVYEKYPQAKRNIERLLTADHAPSKRSLKRKREEEDDSRFDSENGDPEEEEEWSGIEDSGEGKESEGKKDINHSRKEQRGTNVPGTPTNTHGPKLLFSVDAKKLGAGIVGGGKEVRNGFPHPKTKSKHSKSSHHHHHHPLPSSKESPATSGGKKGGGPWDIICFNFPHVGGLSTDVNRQVRSNQELLVSFFKACVPLLSTPDPERGNDASMSSSEDENEYYSDDDDDDDDYDSDNEDEGRRQQKSFPPRTEPGQILVTVFEGEPYTLWNVRDLARHTGLRVVRSFKFPWSSYPGYSHARTLGEIEAKDGSGRGGWRGEEREARTFIFEVKDVDGGDGHGRKNKGPAKGRGRKGVDDDSSDG